MRNSNSVAAVSKSRTEEGAATATSSTESPGRPAGTKRSTATRLVRMAAQEVPTLLVLLGLFAAWEIVVRLFHVPEYLLPPPSAIVRRIVTDFGQLVPHLWVTTYEVLLGLGLSIGLGVPIAIGIVYSRLFERIAYSLIVSSQTVPKAALAPIIVIWLGYGLTSKVVVAFLIAFFPIVINTVIGMRSVEREMIYLAKSLGASALQIFVKIRLPAALPSLFGGIKVATTLAVVGAVVGEFIAANKGLGYLQLLANGNLDTVLLFASVVLLSLLGVVLFAIVSVVELLAIQWKTPEADGPVATM